MDCEWLSPRAKSDLFASEIRGQNTQMRENALGWDEELSLEGSVRDYLPAGQSSPYANRFLPICTTGNEGQRQMSYTRGKPTHNPALCAKLPKLWGK